MSYTQLCYTRLIEIKEYYSSREKRSDAIKNLQNFIRIHRVALLSLLLIIGLFFSFQPVISFGTLKGTHLEVSLAQIGVCIFILGASFGIVTQRARLIRHKWLALLIGFALFATISLLWSPNIVRGSLNAVLLWGFVLLWASLCVRATQALPYAKLLIAILLLITIFVGLFSYFQLFGDALGLSTAITLLPAPYVSDVFGFARPTAFALEPQFLGSLLIIPILYTSYLELHKKASILSRVALVVSLSVLILTISRGAYIALFVGMLIILITSLRRERLRTLLPFSALAACSIVIAFSAIAFATQINDRNTVTPKAAIAKSLNQLSLGVIKIPEQQPTPPTQTNENSSVPQVNAPQTEQKDENIGYVAESTNSRVLMSQEALRIWSQNPQTILAGVGIGGFGVTLHDQRPINSIGSIVNNQYLEILAETGLIGLTLFMAVIGYAFTVLIRNRRWLFVGILSAFCIQWLFFSGNVNVLHVWTFLGIALVSTTLSKRPSSMRASSAK